MATNNSINVSSPGIVGFTGTAFVETSATNHAVMVGGATTSTFSNVGPTSTSGQVLQSAGASADPAFSTATYPATAGTSGNVLTSDGTNFISTAPVVTFLVASGNLSNGQIKALHGTPVQIIAAPGVGKVIHIISGVATMNYGGNNVFTNAGGSQLRVYYGTGTNALSLMSATAIVALASQFTTGPVTMITPTVYATLSNSAINLYNDNATEWAGNAANDNTMSYNIMYRIVTIP